MEYLGIQSQIRRNNVRSTALLILFPCLVLLLTWLFFFILIHMSGYQDENGSYVTNDTLAMVNALAVPVIPWVMGACAVWFIIAYFINTSMIKNSVHAHSLTRKENMRVYNLVENLCISQGIKMPKLNVVEDNSLNAFASGINDRTYTITLTRGIINKLGDDELEGVIAHELSHIRNRDVRLLIVSIIFVGIFAFLAQLLLRSLVRSRKDKATAMIIIALILAALGYLISSLIRFAISRKREFMADAGAAQMTRNPLALASALRKISGDNEIESLTRDDVAQLFIEHGVKSGGFVGRLFATHPPIQDRIRVLEQF